VEDVSRAPPSCSDALPFYHEFVPEPELAPCASYFVCDLSFELAYPMGHLSSARLPPFADLRKQLCQMVGKPDKGGVNRSSCEQVQVSNSSSICFLSREALACNICLRRPIIS